ncbi:MAG TPA: AI-2E family transporter [Candidatus Angelobacter sp.]|nr:AI-2E family transporter [Candidatus Angelobacter sp.]
MDNTRVLFPGSDVTAASRLLTLVGVVVVLAGLYFGRQILIPLALAVVFAFLLTPIVELLEKCHFGRVPSALATLVLSFALLAVAGWGVSKQLMEIMVHLPDYRANIHNKIEASRTPASGFWREATATVNDLSKELSAAAEAVGNKKLSKNGGGEAIAVQVAAPPRTVREYLREVAGPLTGILEMAAIVVIFTLFILLKRKDLRNRLLHLAGSGQLNVMTQAINEASQRLGRYLLLQFVVNAGYGLLFGLGVYFIGIPHPLLWGVLGGLGRFIPYVGTLVAATFPMAMAMAMFPGWGQVGLTFALFLFLEITIGNVIEPWLYGAHTGVSSLAILVAAVFWGVLWGPVGLILSTPLTVCLILMGRYIPQLSFLEILLGDEPVLSPQAHFYQRLLALDDDEARDIADKYLKENSLGNLYDSVLVPALSLAEQDRHRDVLDETRTKFIHQSMRELIEELHEVSFNATVASNGDSPAVPAATATTSGLRMVCVPARDEADEIVGTMVTQLLQRAGLDAHALPIGPIPMMLEQVEHFHADILCVSALPPFATLQAKSLCKQLRQRYPKAKIVLGLWKFPGDVAKAQERVGVNCADMIGTSLVQIVSLIGEANLLSVSTADKGDKDTKILLQPA